jgi:hypothetical protein
MAVQAKGGRLGVVGTGVWDCPSGNAWRKSRAWNHRVQHQRCRVEKVFGT